MAKSSNTTPSRFHNISDAQLADEIGRTDAALKGVEAEMKALKDEFKARGLKEAAGDDFAVTATDQVAWRLNTKAVRDFLGEACTRFETVGTSTVLRIRAATRFAVAA